MLQRAYKSPQDQTHEPGEAQSSQAAEAQHECAQRVQVPVPLLLYHLMHGEEPKKALGSIKAAIVCHDDHVSRRKKAGRDEPATALVHKPQPTRCLSRSCNSPLHLHASTQNKNAETGRKRTQLEGRKRRLTYQEQ